MTFCGRKIEGPKGTPTVTVADRRRRGQSVSPSRVMPPPEMDELGFAAWDSLELTPVLLWPSPYEVHGIFERTKPRVYRQWQDKWPGVEQAWAHVCMVQVKTSAVDVEQYPAQSTRGDTKRFTIRCTSLSATFFPRRLGRLQNLLGGHFSPHRRLALDPRRGCVARLFDPRT